MKKAVSRQFSVIGKGPLSKSRGPWRIFGLMGTKTNPVLLTTDN
jgi:hypothetical protein